MTNVEKLHERLNRCHNLWLPSQPCRVCAKTQVAREVRA